MTAIVNWIVTSLTLPFTALVSAVLYFRLKAVQGEAAPAGPGPDTGPTDWDRQPAV